MKSVIVSNHKGAEEILRDFIGHTLKGVERFDCGHTIEMRQILLEFDEPEQEQPKADCSKRRFTLDEEEEIYQNMVSLIREGEFNRHWENLTNEILLSALDRQVAE